MAIKPLYDRVVVRRLDPETTTRGGIIIPDKAAEKPNQGEVIAVGCGAILESGNYRPLSVSIGDRVLFGQYAGTEISVDGEKLLMMKESDLLAVVIPSQLEEKAA